MLVSRKHRTMCCSTVAIRGGQKETRRAVFTALRIEVGVADFSWPTMSVRYFSS